jgi:hypothetical protein
MVTCGLSIINVYSNFQIFDPTLSSCLILSNFLVGLNVFLLNWKSDFSNFTIFFFFFFFFFFHVKCEFRLVRDCQDKNGIGSHFDSVSPN